jgi:hypothetical protein
LRSDLAFTGLESSVRSKMAFTGYSRIQILMTCERYDKRPTVMGKIELIQLIPSPRFFQL